MRIREACPGAEHAVADVHVRSWKAAYRSLLPDDYLDALRPEDRIPGYTFGSASDPVTLLALGEAGGWARDGATRWEDPWGVRSEVFRLRRALTR